MTSIVAMYARVSTDRQDTDNQMIRLREWASNNGWTVYNEYVDVASGKNTRRPSLTKMLEDAKMHRFDTIIAVKIDRIGRSVLDFKNIMEKLEAWDVKIKMLDQDIDTSTASGRFMITMLSAVAEFEREVIVERVNDGLRRAEKEGKVFGRPKKTLSDYQVEKARRILAENPTISNKQLADQFEGISRNTLIKGLRDLGIIGEGCQKTLSDGVYKETPKKSDCQETTDL